MAKKKTASIKDKEASPTSSPITTITQVKAEAPQSFSYTGTVKVSLLQGGRSVMSKTFKNNGSNSLFKFLAQCLAGQYTQAESSRPIKIRLYHNSTASPGSVEISNPFNNAKSLSAFIVKSDRSELVETSSGGTSSSKSYTAVIHFTIPATFIQNLGTDTTINQIAIFGSSASSDNDWLAYYLFQKINELTRIVEWDGIPLKDLTVNTILAIDWTMAISN